MRLWFISRRMSQVSRRTSKTVNFGTPRLGIKRVIVLFFSVLGALFSVAVVLDTYPVSESQDLIKLLCPCGGGAI
jgi:hypothetical protein